MTDVAWEDLEEEEFLDDLGELEKEMTATLAYYEQLSNARLDAERAMAARPDLKAAYVKRTWGIEKDEGNDEPDTS